MVPVLLTSLTQRSRCPSLRKGAGNEGCLRHRLPRAQCVVASYSRRPSGRGDRSGGAHDPDRAGPVAGRAGHERSAGQVLACRAHDALQGAGAEHCVRRERAGDVEPRLRGGRRGERHARDRRDAVPGGVDQQAPLGTGGLAPRAGRQARARRRRQPEVENLEGAGERVHQGGEGDASSLAYPQRGDNGVRLPRLRIHGRGSNHDSGVER